MTNDPSPIIHPNVIRFVRRTGQWLFVPGIMSLTALPFCFQESSKGLLLAFGGTAGFTLLLGGAFSCLRVKGSLEGRQAMASVALGWLLVAIMCGLPLYVSALTMGGETELSESYGTPINAFFEGMSGITSCGLTLSDRPDLLPMAVQWWRSICEWVGGIGVVMLTFLILQPKGHEYEFYRAEARSWTLEAGVSKTIFHIWTLYLGLTILSILCMRFSGTFWWEAVNHGMTAISTGGFTIRSDSFLATSAPTRIVAILFMVLGGISFRAYHLALFQRQKPWKSSTQLQYYLCLLLVGGAGLIPLVRLGDGTRDSLRIFFQWVSALGTCGFSSLDLSAWQPEALLLLVIAMSIGGAAGSTTGGIKISRLAWSLSFVIRKMREQVTNREISEPYSYDHHEVDMMEARKRIHHALVLICLWVVTVLTGWIALLMLMPSTPPVHLLFETVSALGSVGLTTGVTAAGMPDAAKLCLILLMWLGRLEFISVLMLAVRPWRLIR